MRDPEDGTPEGPSETLQVGPSRPPLIHSVPARWRRPVAASVAFLVGVAAGAGAVLWWQAQPAPPTSPTPPRVRADEHAVELVLFRAVPRPGPTGEGAGPLHIDGALLLSGQVTSTVLSIEFLGESLDVRAPRLPLTVSPSDRFRSIRLRVRVGDCERAVRWDQPGVRPFIITWRDAFDRTHTDRAGDFGKSTGDSMVRYMHAVCDNR